MKSLFFNKGKFSRICIIDKFNNQEFRITFINSKSKKIEFWKTMLPNHQLTKPLKSIGSVVIYMFSSTYAHILELQSKSKIITIN